MPKGEAPVAKPSTACGLEATSLSMMSAPKTATAAASGWITTSTAQPSRSCAALLRVEHHAPVDDRRDHSGRVVDKHHVGCHAWPQASEIGTAGEPGGC